MNNEVSKKDLWPNIIDARQFSREWLEYQFFPTTVEMKKIFEEGGSNLLVGKKMVVLFYEPSTRTRYFFQVAMQYMGGGIMFSTENAREFSSAKKGESLVDTIRVINRGRPDVIVLRYDEEGGAEIAANISPNVVINAGDGSGQHPTQSLLDIFTIRQEIGKIDNLSIAMVGDLLNGRTVRSLCYLLGKYNGVKIHFVSPKNARMKDDIKEYLTRHNVVFDETNNIQDVIHNVDVVYQTRTQKERGTVIDDTEDCYCTIDSGVALMMKPQAIIMHPLPRVNEITPSVDKDQRAVYLTTQLDSSIYTKMALLQMTLCQNG